MILPVRGATTAPSCGVYPASALKELTYFQRIMFFSIKFQRKSQRRIPAKINHQTFAPSLNTRFRTFGDALSIVFLVFFLCVFFYEKF